MKLSDLPQIPKDRDGPVFNAPWEAQAFAMAVKLNEASHFTWTEWAEMLGAEIAARPGEPYYENWLAALEKLVEKKGTDDAGRAPTSRWRMGPRRQVDAARRADRTQPIVANHGNCSSSQ